MTHVKLAVSLALVASVLLLIGGFVVVTGHGSTPSAIAGEGPTKTEAPKKTEEPKKTEAPKKTEEPKKTEAPKNTEEPKKTEEPTKTEAPKKTPTATATPSPTNTPRRLPTNTPTRTPTDTPIPTDTPAPTDTPMPTDTPAPTDTPTPAVAADVELPDAGSDGFSPGGGLDTSWPMALGAVGVLLALAGAGHYTLFGRRQPELAVAPAQYLAPAQPRHANGGRIILAGVVAAIVGLVAYAMARRRGA